MHIIASGIFHIFPPGYHCNQNYSEKRGITDQLLGFTSARSTKAEYLQMVLFQAVFLKGPEETLTWNSWVKI